MFESLNLNKEISSLSIKTKSKIGDSKALITNNYVQTPPKCVVCQQLHLIYSCDEFKKPEINARIQIAKDLKLCLNCLRKNHISRDCKSSLCNKRHHTLLHLANNSSTAAEQQSTCTTSQSISLFRQTQNLLSTALIRARNSNGKFELCQVLLDSGSQSNFVTTSYIRKLGLSKTKANLCITGINQKPTAVNYKAYLTLSSRKSSLSHTISCLVIDSITGNVPSATFNASTLEICSLADPNFNVSGKVDMLIGTNLFWYMHRSEEA